MYINSKLPDSISCVSGGAVCGNVMNDSDGMNNMNGTLRPFPAETPIGMCYVPFQQWEKPYAENIALEQGTMFPSLDLPFLGREVSGNGRT